ncbi:sugar ABC transporter permease [Vallitalea longa]|uniref:Sugar ABC transporter permease n=1 Tax=Vallitalea longa TaxID=2936439 RepID=A0A9W5Y899_9FIRM|nr:carbohydrate ABC transporter permease [Vallitalea longa]GKX28304.1 sugar ABC transporter permease [Vallitalea longa]
MKTKKNISLYITIIIIAIIWLIPLYVIFLTPFKTSGELFSNILGLPKSFSFANLTRVWEEIDVLHYMKNSVIITFVSIVITVLLSSLAAFAISRSKWKITKATYFLFVLGLMIPTQVGMVPLFLTVKSLNLYNNYFGLILSYIAMSTPISIFIFVGFFSSLPNSILEAAYIDGCKEMQIYSKIVMPLSKAAVSTTVIYNSVLIWNDFTYPLLFTRGDSIKPLPLAIYSMKGEYMSDYPAVFAGIVIATIPILVIYIILQKQFIQGMTAGAVKG